MAEGLHRNLLNEAFVRTPPEMTERIVHNLLQFPHIQGNGIDLPAPFTVTDPTAGEGDLLAPFAAIPGASLFGVELSTERADKARALLPQATIVSSPLEAVRFEGAFAQVLASNPPYFLQNGKRAEYTLFKMATDQLQPGGIGFGVFPARSAWDQYMVTFWVKNYEHISVWRFADGDPDTDEFAFEKYTQIVTIGVKRAVPLDEVEKGEYVRLRGFRYRKPDKEEDSWWAGGEAPPVLPETPIADRYVVLSGQMSPRYTLIKADDSQLLSTLEESGAHMSTDWKAATHFEEKGAVAPSAMPLLGMAHMAADILSGLFDGELVLDRYIMTTFTTQRFMSVEPDDDQKAKGIRSIEQSVDHPILGVIDMTTGKVSYYEGSDDTFAFLQPLLMQFAPLVIAKRKPRYQLDPQNWEIDQISRIGLDKQLPGAAHAGLAVPQMHRVLALFRSLNGE